MKILQVIHSVNPRAGGTTEALRQFSAALIRRGMEVEALTLDTPDAPWNRDFPLPLHALGTGRAGYGYAPGVIPWLVRRGAGYDLIVVNGLWQFGSYAVWRATRRTGRPYVVFPHGMLDPWFKRRYPLKHLKKWLYWPWAEYRVLRDAEAVFFTSEQERLDARKSFWLYQCREEVLGFGIDPPPAVDDSLFRRKFPELEGRRLFLFLGRFHEKKGCDLLLRAFQRVRAETDLHLVMAGPPDNSYAAEMARLSRELGLEKRVTWTGMLSGDLKWSAFQSAEAFVLPSHQENFGVSVVEALASGCPVLISNKVNIWREVSAAQAGLVENDDPEGTVRLLERWLALDPAARANCALHAKKCFEHHFQMTAVADKFVSTVTVNGPTS
jgi:glycosyltransferase involved in cell wall biosynthesis